MTKPPQTPPSSDTGGVHRDGTRPSKTLPPDGQDAGDLEDAARGNAARPDYSDDRSGDDRTR